MIPSSTTILTVSTAPTDRSRASPLMGDHAFDHSKDLLLLVVRIGGRS
jgi:hypothetical protein